MIKSFGNRGTEDIFEGDFRTKEARKLPTDILKRALLLLDVINNAISLDALRVPSGNRLKELSGLRKGVWSVRINDQWSITFKFHNNEFYNVQIEDYHK